jgi:acyl-CoA thioesterase
MTVYFHADVHALQAVGNDFVLAQARAQEYRGGFFDQTAQLWARDGTMLATTHQLVYYKS